MIKKILLIAIIGIMYSSQVASARPLSLSESVEMAMNKDESIMAAQASQEGAKWSLSAARRQKGLTLNWSSQALRIGGRDYKELKARHNMWHKRKKVIKSHKYAMKKASIYF